MKIRQNKLDGGVRFMCPVLLPTVTENAQVFSTSVPSAFQASTLPTNGGADFRDVLHGLDLVLNGNQEDELPAGWKPGGQQASEPAPMTTSRKLRAGALDSNGERADRTPSPETADTLLVPVTNTPVRNEESLPATFSSHLFDGMPSSTNGEPLLINRALENQTLSDSARAISTISLRTSQPGDTISQNKFPDLGASTTPWGGSSLSGTESLLRQEHSAFSPYESTAANMTEEENASSRTVQQFAAQAPLIATQGEAKSIELGRPSTGPRESSESKQRQIQSEDPVAPSSVLDPSALIAMAAVPPSSSNSTAPPDAKSQSEPQPPTRKNQVPAFAGRFVAKLESSAVSQPAFNAFEAKLTPRISQPEQAGDSASLPAASTDTASVKAQPFDTALKAAVTNTQTSSSNDESARTSAKSIAPEQPRIAETTPEKPSTFISPTDHPSDVQRQEPTERQPTTTQVSLPHSQTNPRPQVFQQAKTDTQVREASAPEPTEPVGTQVVTQTAPARDFSFRIGNGGTDSVNVKVVDRAGQLHVAVQSSDSSVAQTLQSGVKELARNLENTGFHTETFIPGRTQATPDPQQNPAFQDFQQNRRAPEQDQRVPKKRRSGTDAAFTLIPNQENQ